MDATRLPARPRATPAPATTSSGSALASPRRYKHNVAFLDQQANEVRNGIHRTRLAADGDDYIEAVRRWDAREGDAFFKIAGHPDAHPRTTNLIWHYNHETDRAAVSLSSEDPLAIEWSPPPASNSLTV